MHGSNAKKISQAVRIPTTQRSIRIRDQQPKEAKKISDEFKLSPIAARILAARGYKANADLKNFLDPTLKEGLPDPSKLKNLDAACKLIEQTIEMAGSIAICCDFDVDGLSGGAQVYKFFKEIGVASQVFVPDRFEDGYGLN